MTVSLGEHFKAVRLSQGLTLEAVAQLTGIGKARKIAGKIAVFEQGGTINDELLARLADALDVDHLTIEVLMVFQHARLVYRSTGTAEGIPLETSVYESTITGLFLLEQVVGGKQEIRSSVVLGPTLASELLPLLEKIGQGENV